jgi:hypothetical protein
VHLTGGAERYHFLNLFLLFLSEFSHCVPRTDFMSQNSLQRKQQLSFYEEKSL